MVKVFFWLNAVAMVFGFILVLPECLKIFAWFFNQDLYYLVADNIRALMFDTKWYIRWGILAIIGAFTGTLLGVGIGFAAVVIVGGISGKIAYWIHSSWPSVWPIYGVFYVIAAASVLFAIAVVFMEYDDKVLKFKISNTANKEDYSFKKRANTQSSEEQKHEEKREEKREEKATHEQSETDLQSAGKSPYEILGVSKDSSSYEIAQAYNKMLSTYKKESNIKIIKDAYEILKLTGAVK